jgi:hypothetical protein
MKYLISFCILFLSFNAESNAVDIEDFNTHFRLLPAPQKIEVLSGEGLMGTDLNGIYLNNPAQQPVLAGQLACLPRSHSQSAGIVSLIIAPELLLPSTEGYTLEIRDKQVIIKALTSAGLFYGVQTLDQLMEDSHEQQIKIPACRITDYPEIAYRAVHLDLKHHLDAGYYYYSIIDRLAKIKVNAIIIEFEDKLRYRRAPLVGALQAISIEEFAAISKYAEARNIEISPLVQGLGHASFILKHDAYKQLRDDPASDWVFDPLNPETYNLQFALYEDAMAATPYGKYLHVGGDEVGSLGKSELSRKSGKTPLELQMYWLKKVTDFALEHNRIPIFWDDMILKLANLYKTTYSAGMPASEVADLWKKNESLLKENLPLFPKNCVYMRWNYDNPLIPGNRLAIDWYKANNLPVMAATAGTDYATMFPRTGSKFQPIKEFCQLTTEKKMNGILCTVWDDASPHFETLWRGLFNFALFSWNYEDISMDNANSIFRHRFYASALEPSSFEFQDQIEETTRFWETAFLKDGDREVYHKTFNLIDLPDLKNKGTWSKTYNEKLIKAASTLIKQVEISSMILKAQELTRRNRYSLSLFNVINELQVYSSELLMLMKELDQSGDNEQINKALQIKKHIESFEGIRTRFEKTYSESRMLGNPAGYQLDSNFHHHLANGSNNTDWMYLYELPMNKKIMEWLSKLGI